MLQAISVFPWRQLFIRYGNAVEKAMHKQYPDLEAICFTKEIIRTIVEGVPRILPSHVHNEIPKVALTPYVSRPQLTHLVVQIAYTLQWLCKRGDSIKIIDILNVTAKLLGSGVKVCNEATGVP